MSAVVNLEDAGEVAAVRAVIRAGVPADQAPAVVRAVLDTVDPRVPDGRKVGGNGQLLKPCGTVAAYKRGCRCDDCRRANREHVADVRAGRGRRGRRVAAQHGSRSKYTAGCRCDACRAAERAYQRERHERRRAGVGR